MAADVIGILAYQVEAAPRAYRFPELSPAEYWGATRLLQGALACGLLSSELPVILCIHRLSTAVLYGQPYFPVKLGCSRPIPAVRVFAIGLALLFFSSWIAYRRPQSKLDGIRKVKE